MLFRIYFSIAMIVFSGLGHVMPLSDVPRPFARPTSSEITVSDLQWKAASQIPESLRRSTALRSWVKDVYGHEPSWLASVEVDSSNQTHEVLVASSYSGAAGRNFLLVAQDKKGHWRTLTSILGAPIFVEDAPNRAMDLQVYSKWAGEIWLSRLVFSGGKYRFHSETRMPRILVGPCFYMRWQQLNLFQLDSKKAASLCHESESVASE
jgi:hypothetical protein